MGCYVLLPGDLPDPGIEPRPPALQTDALTSEPPEKPLERAGQPLKGKELSSSQVSSVEAKEPRTRWPCTLSQITSRISKFSLLLERQNGVIESRL